VSTVLETLKLTESVHIGVIWDANGFFTEENGYSLDNAKKGFSEDELIDYYVGLAK